VLKKSQIITIAGTNGKGETTHRLSRYLHESSHCAWTSPHIERINERFSSEMGEISTEELSDLVFRCHEMVLKENYQLSYYEFLFFVFCQWCAQRRPRFILLEVGLGGRMDAVNALDADLVLLTSISRDHQEILGKRYEQILGEKCGVLRPQGKLISFLDLKYLRERLGRVVAKLECEHLDLESFKLLAPHAFSQRNQLLAYAAFLSLKNLPFDPQSWKPSEEKLENRGEFLSFRNEYSLYGSHNVDGMRKLIQFLHSANYNSREVPFDAVLVSFSKRTSKDVSVMLRMLKRAQLGVVMVTSFSHPKAFDARELEHLAHQEGLDFVHDIRGSLQNFADQKILVVGSYYFLGELKPLLST
jgi:dihydrofolate synthase/folylpolyglutamate synthase